MQKIEIQSKIHFLQCSQKQGGKGKKKRADLRGEGGKREIKKKGREKKGSAIFSLFSPFSPFFQRMEKKYEREGEGKDTSHLTFLSALRERKKEGKKKEKRGNMRSISRRLRLFDSQFVKNGETETSKEKERGKREGGKRRVVNAIWSKLGILFLYHWRVLFD